MLFTDVIRKKRDGGELSADEIQYLVDGLADGSLPAEQVSALAMAIFLNSMSFDEAGLLTIAMAQSGSVLEWQDAGLDGPVVDKHSTGGVGDKVSFLLAPIAAACGCYVPMISGRGLGHTGGTTDKAESIPGYQATPDFALFRKVVASVGCAIIGQTADLAPADRRLYAIRDVTATVESVPLITASILSKKIAAGLDGLVMDVKVGSGAFMQSMSRAEELSRSIIGTAARAGLKTHAVITDMNEVLGYTAGNALEIAESVRYLRNEGSEARLDEVVRALTAEMLLLTGIERDAAGAAKRVDEAIRSGAAAERFARMVAELGGPADFIDRYEHHLPTAPVIQPVYLEQDGYLHSMDTHAIGNAIIELGGGRRVLGEALDLAVGFSDFKQIGDAVDKQHPVAMVHASTVEKANQAVQRLRAAAAVSPVPPEARAVVCRTIDAA
ncbi:thymidine phosphorylase [Woeseia oceani]|uniref:Thymidine phosphorylase n=1 Tax=Woeseia oceani TaxID=1548547 RepID=A0A193LIR7_9GAMM|nr:thymidine phosphorylase [Woeseia oceani]ANO52402.1 thymidine phosphorylase [Woeseia oceani]